MKLKHSWDGITVVIKGQANKPIHEEKRWGGMLGDVKERDAQGDAILTKHEHTNIGDIEIKIGGMLTEVEVSLEETVQNIKNIKELSKTLREESVLWLDLGMDLFATFKACEDANTAECAKMNETAAPEAGVAEPLAQPKPEETPVAQGPTAKEILEAGIKAIVAKVTGGPAKE